MRAESDGDAESDGASAEGWWEERTGMQTKPMNLRRTNVPLEHLSGRAAERQGVALLAPDGGLVLGKQRKKHHPRCSCPNCNRARRRLHDHELALREMSKPEEQEHVSVDRTLHESLAHMESRRRSAIAVRNASRLPWNAGKQRDELTKERIRHSTAVAMRRSDIRERLREFALKQNQSEERRRRTSAGLRAYHMKRNTQKLIDRLQSAFAHVLCTKELPVPVASPEPAPDKNHSHKKQRTKQQQSREKSELHRHRIAMSVMNKWRNDPEYRERVSKGQQKQKVKQQIASHLTSEQLQQRRQLLQRGYELLRKAEIAANAIKAKSANGEDIADETIQRYDDAVHRARSSVESLEDNVRWLEESMCEYASEASGSNSHDADYSASQTEEGNREVAAAFASR